MNEGLQNRVTDVYFAFIPENVRTEKVYPEQRNEEINACANEKLRIQKYCVWKLLERALACSFGLDLNTLEFKKENGKWRCNGAEFSLSHSADAVAVAVSDLSVGVDIELVRPLPCEKLAAKILTQAETEAFVRLDENAGAEYIFERWTRKESAFKMSGGALFSQTDADGGAFYTERIERCGRSYFLSVCGGGGGFRLTELPII